MPTPSKSVQFSTVDAVIAAYENREVPAFAIWCGKQFLFKYEDSDIEQGKETLLEMLQLLQSNHSAAIYTLSVYEDLKGKIKDNTNYDGSFNFRFQEHAIGYLPGMPGGTNAIQTELAALRLQVKKLQEENEGEEEENKLGIVGEILQHPAVEPVVPVLIGRLVDLLFPEEPAKTARVAGINVSEVSDNDKVREAITRLSESVPDLPDLLMKLAMISVKKPSSFKFYMSTLRGMSV
jgi:hypothetical protein